METRSMQISGADKQKIKAHQSEKFEREKARAAKQDLKNNLLFAVVQLTYSSEGAVEQLFGDNGIIRQSVDGIWTQWKAENSR